MTFGTNFFGTSTSASLFAHSKERTVNLPLVTSPAVGDGSMTGPRIGARPLTQAARLLHTDTVRWKLTCQATRRKPHAGRGYAEKSFVSGRAERGKRNCLRRRGENTRRTGELYAKVGREEDSIRLLPLTCGSAISIILRRREIISRKNLHRMGKTRIKA